MYCCEKYVGCSGAVKDGVEVYGGCVGMYISLSTAERGGPCGAAWEVVNLCVFVCAELCGTSGDLRGLSRDWVRLYRR